MKEGIFSYQKKQKRTVLTIRLLGIAKRLTKKKHEQPATHADSFATCSLLFEIGDFGKREQGQSPSYKYICFNLES